MAPARVLAWTYNHMTSPPHPIFEQFTRYKGPVKDGWIAMDFLGTTARREFLQSAIGPTPSYLETNYPPANEDLYAWIDLLTAVLGAGQSFTMMELGAGFGLWSMRAAKAVQQRRGIPFKIVAVEAEPHHFSWLNITFADNGLNPADHRLIEAAVSDSPGTALFYVASPDLESSTPREWWGQSLIKDYEAVAEMAGSTGEGRPVAVLKSGWRGVEVARITLNELLGEHELVDFIHMDVQGQELPAVRASIDLLDEKVKYLHIGTHSREIETELREILGRHRWTCHADWPGNQEQRTPFGVLRLQDGIQSWANPKFCSD
jgi:FkbM family methyltransferase